MSSTFTIKKINAGYEINLTLGQGHYQLATTALTAYRETLEAELRVLEPGSDEHNRTFYEIRDVNRLIVHLQPVDDLLWFVKDLELPHATGALY